MEFFRLDAAAPADSAALAELFADHTVLVPAVSFANLGQLTLDLIINSLLQRPDDFAEIVHVGHLLSANVPPLAGGPAFGTQDAHKLSLNLQVYSSASKKVTIIQQRTTVMPGRSQEFARELVEWAVHAKVASLCVVAGADDMLRHDPNMLSRPIRTIYSRNAKANNTELLAQFAALSTDESPRAPDAEWKAVRGAGIAPLLQQECEQKELPFVAWVMAVAEGDNVPDAVALATQLARYLDLAPIPGVTENQPPRLPFAFPPSWSQLFGRRPDVSLYL